MSKISIFQEKIGYVFQDSLLLQQALLHSSLVPRGQISHFERLEFLGDRVLGLLMARWLLQRYPEASEGVLAKKHSVLVSRSTLYEVAQATEISCVLCFDYDTSSERFKRTILSDACEALIGAIFQDTGLEAARSFVEKWWQEPVECLHGTEKAVDPKSTLQEWVQGKGKPLPAYKIISVQGPDHAPEFKVCLLIEGLSPYYGQGTSRKEAEKEAALKALEIVQKR